jgi:hypothetical protein
MAAADDDDVVHGGGLAEVGRGGEGFGAGCRFVHPCGIAAREGFLRDETADGIAGDRFSTMRCNFRFDHESRDL